LGDSIVITSSVESPMHGTQEISKYCVCSCEPELKWLHTTKSKIVASLPR